MTELLFLTDSYLKKCEATAITVEGASVVFNKTVFSPIGGGLPCDVGKVEANERIFNVIEVRKKEGNAVHTLEAECPLVAGDSCTLAIDWDKRYKIMRMHTATHVLGSTMFENGALITGNQIGFAESRVDFSLENFDRSKFAEIVGKANEKLASNAEVKIYELPREEALKIPGVVKLAGALPPSIPVLRIVEIGNFDLQADGGVHVKNTKECGQIEITRLENKGAKNKRIYFKLA